MSSLNRPPLLDPEGHLPLDLLRQYQADTLAPALRHPVERHLLTCPLCADLAEGLALADPASTQAAVQDLRGRVQASVRRQQPQKDQPAGGGYWRAAAAVLVLFVSAVLVLYQQLSAVRSAETGTAPAAEAPMTQAPPPVLRPASPAGYGPLADATAAPPASEAPPVPLPAAVAQNQIGQERPEQVLKKVGQARERLGEETGNEITFSAPAAPSLASKAGQEAEVVTLDGPVKVETAEAREAIQGRVAGVATSPRAPAGFHVSGRVQSLTGQALPGVSVVVKGTTIGTSTDAAGQYSLQVPEKKETLVFNYLGFEPAEKVVSKEAATLDVWLAEDQQALSEVVVTGQGVQKQTAAAGSTAPAAPAPGLAAYQQYLQEQLRYPEEARPQKLQGRVVVGFTVTPEGQLQNMRVLKSLCPPCDTEALRLIKEGPAWKPAAQNGQPVADQVRVTVRFRP